MFIETKIKDGEFIVTVNARYEDWETAQKIIDLSANHIFSRPSKLREEEVKYSEHMKSLMHRKLINKE